MSSVENNESKNKYLRKTLYFSRGNEDLYEEVISKKDASGYICDLIRKDIEGDKVDSTEIVLSTLSDRIIQECGIQEMTRIITDMMMEIKEIKFAISNLNMMNIQNQQSQQSFDLANAIAASITNAVKMGVDSGKNQDQVVNEKTIENKISEPEEVVVNDDIKTTKSNMTNGAPSGGKKLNVSNRASRFGKNALDKM